MKYFLILSVFVILAHGRPEAPSGYNYQAPPSSRYGAPSGQGGSGFSNEQFRAGGASSAGLGGSSSGIGGSSAGFGGSSSGLGGPSAGFGRSSSGFGSGSFAGSFGSGSGAGFGGSFSSGQSSSGSGFGQSASGQSGRSSTDSIVINKSVYVHVAPPELEEEPQQRAQVRVPPPQKNYKIIFIKAPAPAASQAPQIPPIPQNEEKTLVYVLVKKPEEQADIEIPTAAPTEPSKPEVYFIRYKTQQESGQQQGVTGGQDFSQDDTVEVGARQGGGGFAQGGAGAGQGAGQAAGRQGGASAGGYALSSSKSSSAGLSRQYGAPNSSGPY